MARKKRNNLYQQSLTKIKTGKGKLTNFVKRKPLTSFFLVLLLLLSLIAAGNYLAPKKEEVKNKEIVKPVQIYRIEDNPKVTLQAKIEKSGVIKITALAPGIIKSINFQEGMEVQQGAVLVSISSNYQGGNASSIQRQIAAKQYQNNKDTIDAQKDLINTQKQVAEKNETNASELRDITNESIQETEDLINLNQSILDTINQNETNLENNNPGGINDTAILQLKSQRAGVQAALNQQRAALRGSQFQGADDKPPAELARLQKDVTLKQLDLQQKALELGLEVSRLQLVLAQINEAVNFPASPFNATVQRVHVKVGQTVTPGTLLLTLSANEDPITAVVSIPQNLSSAVSTIRPSTLYLGDQTIDLNPTFVSTEATDGTLYSVFYTIPDSFSKDLTEGGNIAVDIPIGLSQSTSGIPFIPLDSIYQNTDKSFVLIVQGGKAVSKIVSLGNVFGKFVEVKSGLSVNDQIILNRNILAGDKVSI